MSSGRRALASPPAQEPIVDFNRNWRNPIISNRSFGADPDLVLEMGLAYMRGFQEAGAVCGAKHFPGDGIDERHQHLSSSVNSLTCEEWEATFGQVCSGLIEAGLPSIMAGHIMLPTYQRHFSPDTRDEDLLPATLSSELIIDRLKGKLGFNGLVVTDASHMVGLTGAMARRDLVPGAIAASCDLFLFFNDPEEDFGFMLDGYRKGVITEDRMNDALRPSAAFFGDAATPAWEKVADRLRDAGFDVEVFESAMDKIKRLPEEEQAKSLKDMYAGKAPIADFTARADLVINVAEVSGAFQPVERVMWRRRRERSNPSSTRSASHPSTPPEVDAARSVGR